MSRLDDIRERLAKATRGPWQAVECSAGGKLLVREARPGYHVQSSVQIVPPEDADLIAHAPDDLAYLIGEVERLQGLLDIYEKGFASLVPARNPALEAHDE
jgi:hypothetical protein